MINELFADTVVICHHKMLFILRNHSIWHMNEICKISLFSNAAIKKLLLFNSR